MKERTYTSEKEREDLDALFIHVDKPYRILALHAVHTEIFAENFWHLFHHWWTTVENPSEYIKYIEEMLCHNTAGLQQDLHFDESRLNEMHEEDLKAYNSLPDTFTVYRGCHGFNEDGVSWSLDREVAEKFAINMAIDGKRMLLEGVVHKNDIVAYYTGRHEAEIVVLPKHVIHTGRSRAVDKEYAMSKDEGVFMEAQTGRLRERFGDEANLNFAKMSWVWDVAQHGYEHIDSYILYFKNLMAIIDNYSLIWELNWFTSAWDRYRVALLIRSGEIDISEDIKVQEKVREIQEEARLANTQIRFSYEEKADLIINGAMKDAEKK